MKRKFYSSHKFQKSYKSNFSLKLCDQKNDPSPYYGQKWFLNLISIQKKKSFLPLNDWRNWYLTAKGVTFLSCLKVLVFLVVVNYIKIWKIKFFYLIFCKKWFQELFHGHWQLTGQQRKWGYLQTFICNYAREMIITYF